MEWKKQHQVVVPGMNLNVPISLLSEPGEDLRARAVNQVHIQELMKSFHENQTVNQQIHVLVRHAVMWSIFNNSRSDQAKLMPFLTELCKKATKGDVTMETIGGEHSRQALTLLHSKYPDNKLYSNVPITLYIADPGELNLINNAMSVGVLLNTIAAVILKASDGDVMDSAHRRMYRPIRDDAWPATKETYAELGPTGRPMQYMSTSEIQRWCHKVYPDMKNGPIVGIVNMAVKTGERYRQTYIYLTNWNPTRSAAGTTFLPSPTGLLKAKSARSKGAAKAAAEGRTKLRSHGLFVYCGGIPDDQFLPLIKLVNSGDMDTKTFRHKTKFVQKAERVGEIIKAAIFDVLNEGRAVGVPISASQVDGLRIAKLREYFPNACADHLIKSWTAHLMKTADKEENMKKNMRTGLVYRQVIPELRKDLAWHASEKKLAKVTACVWKLMT